MKERNFKLYLIDLCITNGRFGETILERDKEWGRRRSQGTTPRTNDAVAAQKRPPRRGSRLLPVCFVAPPRSSAVTTASSSRLAYGQNTASKTTISYAKVNKSHQWNNHRNSLNLCNCSAPTILQPESCIRNGWRRLKILEIKKLQKYEAYLKSTVSIFVTFFSPRD